VLDPRWENEKKYNLVGSKMGKRERIQRAKENEKLVKVKLISSNKWKTNVIS